MSKTLTALKVMPTAELPQPKYNYQSQSVSSSKMAPVVDSASDTEKKQSKEVKAILRNLKI
jgi:hypothetical protein